MTNDQAADPPLVIGHFRSAGGGSSGERARLACWRRRPAFADFPAASLRQEFHTMGTGRRVPWGGVLPGMGGAGSSFRRDADTNTRDAYAPRNPPLRFPGMIRRLGNDARVFPEGIPTARMTPVVPRNPSPARRMMPWIPRERSRRADDFRCFPRSQPPIAEGCRGFPGAIPRAPIRSVACRSCDKPVRGWDAATRAGSPRERQATGENAPPVLARGLHT